MSYPGGITDARRPGSHVASTQAGPDSNACSTVILAGAPGRDHMGWPQR